MINRTMVLQHGAQFREGMLSNYKLLGTADGAVLARRLGYELGEVLADVHGRADAAALLYSVADAIAAKLPVEDFRLILVAPVAEAGAPVLASPPTNGVTRAGGIGRCIGCGLAALFSAATDNLIIGFVLGLIAGQR